MSILTRWPEEHICLSEEQRQQAVVDVEKAFASTLETLKVDIGLMEMLEAIYVPLAAWICEHQRVRHAPLIVGINGAQGSGKSTLFNLLEVILAQGFGLKVVGFSMDDIYLTQKQRIELAEKVHPLFRTRGVPGTHDVELGVQLLKSLRKVSDGEITKIPVFDKSVDDRCPETVWQEWHGRCDLVIFDGWCLGARPQSEAELKIPINDLEANEDSDGAWRTYVNQQLAGPYQALFDQVDLLIMLKVPSMESVYEWRTLQEKKLAERFNYLYQTQQPTQHLKIMSEAEIRRFIQHYERLTRTMLEQLPDRADITLHLNENHKIHDIQVNSPCPNCDPE